MQCEESRENLVALLHRELPSERQRVVEQHLLDCAGCRQQFESSRQVAQTMQATMPLEPSAQQRAEFHARVEAALSQQRPPALPAASSNPGTWNLLIAPPQQAWSAGATRKVLPPARRQAAASGAPPKVFAAAPTTRATLRRLARVSKPAAGARMWLAALLVVFALALGAAAGTFMFLRHATRPAVPTAPASESAGNSEKPAS